jgi:hypothetical protein
VLLTFYVVDLFLAPVYDEGSRYENARSSPSSKTASFGCALRQSPLSTLLRVVLHPLRTIGRCTLFVYLFHELFITWALRYPFELEAVDLHTFLKLDLLLHLVVVLAAYTVDAVKNQFRSNATGSGLPFLLAFLLGS